jgi:hypothetical protein
LGQLTAGDEKTTKRLWIKLCKGFSYRLVMQRRIKLKFIRYNLLAILFLSLNIQAKEGVSIHQGWITGNTYRAFEATSKNVYAVGLVDGVFLSPLYGAPKEKLKPLEQCTTGMTGQQVVAIFNKYLNENPERWHQSMHVIGFTALKEACDI